MKNLIKFMKEFHITRDYFECHEILEEVWIEDTNCNTKDHPAIILLQIAVGALHWQRKNYSGAKKLFEGVLENMDVVKEEINNLDIPFEELKSLVKEKLELINQKKEYEEFNLPMGGKLNEKFLKNIV